MGPENNVGLGDCWIMESLLPYLCMVTVPHVMVGLERMLNYRGVRLERFHCNHFTRHHGLLASKQIKTTLIPDGKPMLGDVTTPVSSLKVLLNFSLHSQQVYITLPICL